VGIRKPVINILYWHKIKIMEIKLKFSRLKFKTNIKEVVKNLFDFNIGTALTETVSIELTNENKAFLLLLKTIKKTNFVLVKEYGQAELNKETDLVLIANTFEEEIIKFLEEEVVITKEFFEDIIQFNPNYLRQSFLFFKNYLNLLGISYPEDLNFIYFNNFRKNLEEEFQENKDSYKSLIESFDNPIINENKKILKQLEYNKELIKQFAEPLQQDIPESKETLKDLYIEPFFEIHKNTFFSKEIEKTNEFNELKEELSVHDFLKNYYFKNKKHPEFLESYNLLFILGQPGQGKTSFCNKLIYDYLQESEGLPEVPIFFIKIRALVARDFIDTPFIEIIRHIKQNFNFQEDKCILVLDGLDEAYMSGGLNDGDLRNLYERLKIATQSNEDLKIILTSRFNYLKLNDSCIDRSSVIQLSTFDVIQIKEYSEKFRVFYPNNKLVRKIEKILTDENYVHIKELLEQAVLLYFISISDIDIEEKDSRSAIYDKIFTSLAKRSWDKNGQLSYIKTDLKNNPIRYEKLLREYVRNIAFAIYQSPNLYITINQLLQLEATTKFINKCFDDSIEFSQDKIKEISKYLLISFYFQESKNNNSSDTAIEFFHNSLWEYLTAEYMWEENKKVLLEKDSDGDFKITSKEKYFNLLNELVGQKELNYTTTENLISIIENEEKSKKIDVANLSKPLFNKLSEDDFLLEYSSKTNTLTSFEKMTTIFELFWVFYYESNLVTTNSIEMNNKTSTFLFEYSDSFRYENRIINLKFISVSLSIPFTAECTYENILFNSSINNSWFGYNQFNNVIFNDGLFFVTFTQNKFNAFRIDDCEIGKYCHFDGNIFTNCIFNNVYVQNKNWLKDLSKKNKVDSKIIETHKVEEVLEKDRFSEKKVKRYIIRYTGEEDLN
jgi:GTPase SAR1 family protein